MLKVRMPVLALVLFLAACAAPKLDGDPETVRIEPPAPGTSVIYLIRSTRDWSTNASLVFMDDRVVGSTGAGVYYRIEVPPGRHQFTGYAFDNGRMTVDTEANKVYFVEQHVQGMFNRAQVMHSSQFRAVNEARAREVIANIHVQPGPEPEGTVTVFAPIPTQ